MPALGVGLLLVVLDARVPTPVGAVDLLPDVLGWAVVLRAVAAAGWSRLVPPLAVVALVSLLDVVRPGDVRWLEVAQTFTGMTSLFGYLLVATGVEAHARRVGDDVVAARFAGQRRRLPLVAAPVLLVAFLTVTDVRPGPLAALGSLLVLAGVGLVLWLVVDLLRTSLPDEAGAADADDAASPDPDPR